MTYTIFERNGYITIVRSDGLSIPSDPANSDYQDYLRWVEEGNTPLIPEATPPPPPPPSIEERLEAAEALIDMMLEAGGEASNG